jgi:1-acyl-sn-glycerol-3-phosphate acyltransferase
MRARIRGWLTTIYAAVFMALFFFSSLPIMVLTRSGDLPMWFARKAWGPWGLWIAGVDFQIERTAPLPDGPAIYAANHASAIDIWAAVAAIPRGVRFVAKSEMFRWPVFGWYMTVGGHVPVDRRDHARAVASLAKAAVRVRNGTSLIVFPEGTRSREESLLPFKKGAFAIALKTGLPIVPVSISGGLAILPRGLLAIRPGTIVIRYGAPIASVGPVALTRQELAARVRDAVEAGLALDRPAPASGGA